MFFVYILQNPVGNFYTFIPWELVWSEEHPTRAAAMARERQIKAMKSSRWIREVLLKGRVPTGRD